MPKVIIIHGTGGSPEENWFPWLATALTKNSHEVIVPRMPTPKDQSLNSWFTAFYNQVGSINGDTILIGHSLGAVFLLRLLERLSTAIGSSIFVTGFTSSLGIPEYDLLNSSFTDSAYGTVAKLTFFERRINFDFFCLVKSIG
jgi:hypothetical protein